MPGPLELLGADGLQLDTASPVARPNVSVDSATKRADPVVRAVWLARGP